MRFLCDVHIPYKLVNFLNSLQLEAVHVNQILEKWLTKDADICNHADLNDYVIVTKDHDFRDSYFIRNTPKKLVKINLGNISNDELIHIFESNIDSIIKLDKEPNFIIEIDKNNITYLNK